MDTTTAKIQSKVKSSYRETPDMVIGNTRIFDYYVVSPEQRATLLEEEEAILNRKHSYSY